jgi:hypothetical protein
MRQRIPQPGSTAHNSEKHEEVPPEIAASLVEPLIADRSQRLTARTI